MNVILFIAIAIFAAWVIHLLFGSYPNPPVNEKSGQERLEDLHGKELDRLAEKSAEENRQKDWRVNYIEYLRSHEWKWVRQEILNNANHTCKDCGAAATQVHHLEYTVEQRNGVFELENYANLVALCHDCHSKRHGKRRKKSLWKQEVLPLGIRV